MKFKLFFIFLLLSQFAFSIETEEFYYVQGKVVSDDNSMPIQWLSARIEGTNKGSMTNVDGVFKIKLKPGDYKLSVKAIGYQSVFIDFTLTSNQDLGEIRLKISEVLLSEGAIVYAEDAGLRTIRKVLASKSEQTDSLDNYKYKLYTKLVVTTDTLTAGRTDRMADTTVFSILESYSNGYYEKPNEFFNEVFQRRQSMNVPPQANFVSFGTNLNAFDDYVTILNEKIATPFHPDAPDYYDFILERKIWLDESTELSKIKVVPKSNQRKLFEGYVYIDSLKLYPFSVELKPNIAVRLPFDAYLEYNQKFVKVDEQYTMPAGLRIYSSLKAELFWIVAPRLDIMIETMAYDYTINTIFEDDYFSLRRVESSDDVDTFDSLYWKNNEVIPLRFTELEAYDAIRMSIENPDSLEGTGLFDEFLGPFRDFFVKVNRRPFNGFENMFLHNRVVGTSIGVAMIDTISRFAEADFLINYSPSVDYTNYNIGVNLYTNNKSKFNLKARIYDDITRIDNPFIVRQAGVSTIAFLLGNDYGDYYRNRGYNSEISYSWGQLNFIRRATFDRLNKINILYRDENHISLTAQDFSMFQVGDVRPNPQVKEGNLKSITGELFLNYSRWRRLSNLGAYFSYEYSGKELNSEFEFQKIYGEANWRTTTLPLWTLDIRLSYGRGYGNLPPQRYFTFDASLSRLVTAGAFRNVDVKEFYGDEMLAINIEHNFGELVPGLLRIPNIASFGLEFIGIFNFGYTKFNNTQYLDPIIDYRLKNTFDTNDLYYYEAGLAINRIALFFRLDLSVRLTQVNTPQFRINVGAATF